MSCIKSIFKCNFSESNEKQDLWDKNVNFLKIKITELELEVKAMKVSNDLEFKRIEDKLINQIQILSTKIDSLLLIVNKS